MNDENPFKPPCSPLVDEHVPDSFISGALTPRQLGTAGWLSLGYAVLGVPYAVSSLSGAVSDAPFMAGLMDAMTVALTLVWVHLLLVLRRLLESRFALSGIAKYINSAISLTVVLTVLSLFLGDEAASELGAAFIAFVILLVPYGVVMALLGWRILSIQHPYDYLRPFAWITVASGVLMATVVLVVLSMVLDVISAGLLGLVFFRAQKELNACRAAAAASASREEPD
ncbi:MAG: hypothetical protein AMS22_01120 [Thiotrichales bacterium SG8_50]|nr:MAG: hypothetical protein AMS22_01120 [Thiotrichales bacterium SG8_50]